MIKKRRRLQVAILVVALAAAGATCSRYRGLVFPVRIASGSMASALAGPHRQVICGDCGFTFRCGLDTNAPLGIAVCPNCGYARNELTEWVVKQGESVLIDRWAYWRQAPERGDMVAFVDPNDPTQLAVKRVVGLPGERVEIVDGELLIDGQLRRKTLAAAKQTAVLVNDDSHRHQVREGSPMRWRGESGWKATANGFTYDPNENSWASKWSWLSYQHWRCFASPAPRGEPVPIADNYGYNQGLSRELNEVVDVWLSCRVQLAEGDELVFSVHDGQRQFRMKVVGGRSAELSAGQQSLSKVDLTSVPPNASVQIECGLLDQQVLLAIDGRPVITHVYEPDHTPRRPVAQPLRIGGGLHPVLVSNLSIFRDVYYLGPDHARRSWAMPAPLGSDQLFLLGDNVPLSVDSRRWITPALSRNMLLGKVLKREQPRN